jgi:hypothetical protein
MAYSKAKLKSRWLKIFVCKFYSTELFQRNYDHSINITYNVESNSVLFRIYVLFLKNKVVLMQLACAEMQERFCIILLLNIVAVTLC